MTPGAVVIIKPAWRNLYEEQGTPLAGIVERFVSGGHVAQVRMFDSSEFLIEATHLDEVWPGDREDMTIADVELLRLATTVI